MTSEAQQYLLEWYRATVMIHYRTQLSTDTEHPTWMISLYHYVRHWKQNKTNRFIKHRKVNGSDWIDLLDNFEKQTEQMAENRLRFFQFEAHVERFYIS